MTGYYTDYGGEQKRGVRKDGDPGEQQMAMVRIIKKSGCSNLKMFPSWLRELSYYLKKTEWDTLCDEKLKSKRENSPKQGNNVRGNYFHFRKVAG